MMFVNRKTIKKNLFLGFIVLVTVPLIMMAFFSGAVINQRTEGLLSHLSSLTLTYADTALRADSALIILTIDDYAVIRLFINLYIFKKTA